MNGLMSDNGIWCADWKTRGHEKIQHLATENDESKEVEANTNDEEAGSDNFGSEEDTSENVE